MSKRGSCSGVQVKPEWSGIRPATRAPRCRPGWALVSCVHAGLVELLHLQKQL